jgi:hypothetical protein
LLIRGHFFSPGGTIVSNNNLMSFFQNPLHNLIFSFFYEF